MLNSHTGILRTICLTALIAFTGQTTFGAEITITTPAPDTEVSGPVQVVASVVTADGERITSPRMLTCGNNVTS